jgi:hypothetical protein
MGRSHGGEVIGMLVPLAVRENPGRRAAVMALKTDGHSEWVIYLHPRRLSILSPNSIGDRTTLLCLNPTQMHFVSFIFWPLVGCFRAESQSSFSPVLRVVPSPDV